MKVFPGMYHDLLHEKDRRLVIDEARQFIRRGVRARRGPAAAAGRRPLRLHPQRVRPAQRAAALVLAAAGWATGCNAWACKTLGRLSRGVRLGLRRRASTRARRSITSTKTSRRAHWLLGKWIDRAYLNSIGWRGIRQRRTNLEKLLQEAIGRVRADGQPVRLLDIAAGPGRYILETLRDLAGDDLSALLRDNVEANLEAGRKLAAEAGLHNVTFQLRRRLRRGVAGRDPAARPTWPWSPGCMSCSPTTSRCGVRSAGWRGPCSPADISSTPASPGTRRSR